MITRSTANQPDSATGFALTLGSLGLGSVGGILGVGSTW
jgi:hypothetical protein